MGLRDSISKGIGKASNFVNDQQRRYRLKESLDAEEVKLTTLFIELGKLNYYGPAMVTARTVEDVKSDITTCINTIEALKQELTAPTPNT